MTKLYYTPPTDEQFNELKKKAIEVWKELNSHPSYEKEKIDRIKDITNIQDNFMYMVAMFDINNQGKLADKLSVGTKLAVRQRMIDGGQLEYSIPF